VSSVFDGDYYKRISAIAKNDCDTDCKGENRFADSPDLV